LEQLDSLLKKCIQGLHPQNEEMQDLVERTRAKFKAVTAQLGITTKTEEKLNF
jgi:signal transduction histidine kinase